MTAEDLRRIGRHVYEKTKGTPPGGQLPMGRGAGGDRTFPVDKLAEDIILEGLRGLGQRMHIVSEEAGSLDIDGAGEARTVAVDPIDGSKNAVSGIPFWGASIAVSLSGELGGMELGYVINLVNGQEFWAEKGRGAFMDGTPIHCRRDPAIGLCAFEARTPAVHLKEILPLLAAAGRTRCLGSIALDLAYLASGAASLFVSPGSSRSFDYAAGYLLVKEAGGVFTDMQGRELDGQKIGLFPACGGASLLASANMDVHRKALGILNAGK